MRILIVIILALSALYLAFWPVPIQPVAWESPPDQGLSGDFAPNERLAALEFVDLEPFSHPEDIAGADDGTLFVTLEQGAVAEIGPGGELSLLARTGGRPLGIEVAPGGDLIVANAELGLQRVTRDGKIGVLANRHDGETLTYVNDVAVAADGRIYFTQSTQNVDPRKYGGALAASIMDLLEHGDTGRLLLYDPATRSTRVISAGFSFLNGVALAPDESFLLLAETGEYRIWRYWLSGPRTGEREVILNNLPAFPDNINNGRDGRFWIGLVSPRNRLLDSLAGSPFLRKSVQRLPPFLKPKPAPSTHVIAIDRDGSVLANLQHDGSVLTQATGVYETDTHLLLSSLASPGYGRIAKSAVGL